MVMDGPIQPMVGMHTLRSSGCVPDRSIAMEDTDGDGFGDVPLGALR